MVITIMTDLIEAVNFLKSFLKTVFFLQIFRQVIGIPVVSILLHSFPVTK